jgi:hypothetical protein
MEKSGFKKRGSTLWSKVETPMPMDLINAFYSQSRVYLFAVSLKASASLDGTDTCVSFSYGPRRSDT